MFKQIIKNLKVRLLTPIVDHKELSIIKVIFKNCWLRYESCLS